MGVFRDVCGEFTRHYFRRISLGLIRQICFRLFSDMESFLVQDKKDWYATSKEGDEQTSSKQRPHEQLVALGRFILPIIFSCQHMKSKTSPARMKTPCSKMQLPNHESKPCDLKAHDVAKRYFFATNGCGSTMSHAQKKCLNNVIKGPWGEAQINGPP